MPSPSSPALAKATNKQQWIAGVLVLAALVAAGGMLLHSARAKREALVRREMNTPSAAVVDDPAAAPALARYLAKIRAQLRDRNVAYLRLQQQKALAWNIRERTDIDRDRKIIQDFLTTSARLTDSLQHGESYIRAELNTANIPAADRDSILAWYAKSQKPLLPFQMRVQECDEVIGKNALGVLDLLESNWGKWTRDEATGQLNFTSAYNLAVFKKLVGNIAEAANERKQAAKELVDYQKQHSSP
jgi:hypothetical protein